ncbi:P-loop NTPase fold protein [Pantoea dispersa]|uniref:P-loop NTPase fold protein n=1 Tax=Pantoea dispersa TaxID=59814 RepID=UPI000737A03F|nr:P-loop NTPase fold protein [Pantoea dispersa]KTS35194.1 hypothetical protein NS389_07010 [Pantoea dispersa]KTS56087.1 hypothetical protein NS380_17230 [Pantoea dispersa]
MSFILHTESPSNEDIIDGNSHNNISIKIAQTLMRDDVNIIGINGPLGSGKSTVIKLLEKNLPEHNFQFINFDAELYQQGSTKKALITKIYDGLIPKIPKSLKEKLTEYKDDALGNNVTYKKTQDSEVTVWAVMFLFSLFVCSQSIRPLQTEWSKNTESVNYYLIGLFFLFLLSPLIVSGLFFVRSYWDKTLKFGNIIKKNSVDVITEKMLVSKEVGSIELHKAISGFKECIPPGIRFLLVIDNLDRIPSEKVKELWSDIELISNSSEKRLKLLIPYSSDHVAKSLSDDLYEGREFISKRIPISFQIPPILSAGWRNVFAHFWQQSFPNDIEALHHDASELIEIWLPEAYQPITPRYLKKLINDIQITLLSTPYKIKSVICAYYILTTKQNNISFDKLLIENFEADTLDEKLKEKLKKSIRKLQRIYDNDRKKWIDELLCINYQTNAQLAEGELIDEPLKIALTQYNPDELSRISDMFGFNSAWRRVIDITDPTDWFVTLSKLSDEKSHLVKEVLPVVIKSIDSIDITSATTLENETFLPSLNLLKKNGFNIHGLYLDSIQKRIIDKTHDFISYDDDKLIELGENHADIQIALQECDLLSQLLGYDLLKELPVSPKAVFYMLNLKDKASTYKHMNIDGLKLTSVDFIHALQLLYLSEVNFNLTERNVSKHINFESDGIQNTFKEGLLPGVELAYNKFVSGTAPDNILPFEMVILSPHWHNADLNNHYARIIGYNIDWKSNCLAHWMAHMIASKKIISIESYKGYVSNEDELIEFFSCYLRYISDFNRISDALKNESLNTYLIPALELISNIGTLQIKKTSEIISDSFSVLKQHLSVFFIEKLLSDNKPSFCEGLEGVHIKKMDSALIDYIIERDVKDELQTSLINSISLELNSQDQFNKTSDENYGACAKILTFANKIDVHFDFAKDYIYNFYETYKIDAIDRPIPRLIFNTLLKDDQSVVLRNLSDLIYMRDIDVRRQVALLRNFSDLLVYSEDESTSGSRAISRLFNQVQLHPEIASWLDQQNINFAKWNNSDKQATVNIIANNIELFPLLKEKTPVKKRISEMMTKEE